MPALKGGLVTPLLKLGHGTIIRSHIKQCVITYPCPNLSWTMLVNGSKCVEMNGIELRTWSCFLFPLECCILRQWQSVWAGTKITDSVYISTHQTQGQPKGSAVESGENQWSSRLLPFQCGSNQVFIQNRSCNTHSCVALFSDSRIIHMTRGNHAWHPWTGIPAYFSLQSCSK